MVWRRFCDKKSLKIIISDLNGDEILGMFYGKELQKTNPEEIRVEKVINRKGDKLYVKWKGYDYSWIDKKTWYKRVNIFLKRNILEGM